MLNCRLGASFREAHALVVHQASLSMLVRGAKKYLEHPDVMRGGLTKPSSTGIKMGWHILRSHQEMLGRISGLPSLLNDARGVQLYIVHVVSSTCFKELVDQMTELKGFSTLSLSQVANFPFKGNTSFLIVMPMPGRGNVSLVLPKLNISDLYRRLPQEKIMQVNLPRMKLQYRQELQEALTGMGEKTDRELSSVLFHYSMMIV